MASYAENGSFFRGNNDLHNCLLTLSNAGALVERVQVRDSGTLVQVKNGESLDYYNSPLTIVDVQKSGVAYRQTEICGCTVVWLSAPQQVAA